METDKAPAELELLDTTMRFEADGTSRKEVHTRVRINNELGARQFGRLTFDYNRAFENVEIPLVRVTHPSGGTSDVLPSAISDQPHPAVTNAPAYADVRRKSVRILGLAEGDLLEYRIITKVTHAPLAPEFYLAHSFAREGLVKKEIFELDLPAQRKVQMYVNPLTPPNAKSTAEGAARTVYRWERVPGAGQTESGKGAAGPDQDVIVSTLESWEQLAELIAKSFQAPKPTAPEIVAKAAAIIAAASPTGSESADGRLGALYDFASQKISTVDVPLGATGFRTRPPTEILSSGYGTPEDKYVLFAALAAADNSDASPLAALVSREAFKENTLPRPTVFEHILTFASGKTNRWLDLSMEVAPFGAVAAEFRGKRALLLGLDKQNAWRDVPRDLPYAAKQRVDIDATLSAEGKLTAKVRYALRADNELLLRLAFYKTPKEKWKDIAQLLSISDGFRGQVRAVSTSDPTATHEPFTVEYEMDMPKFVDWSKKPVRIPALLPQLGLPDSAGKRVGGWSAIELGTPLEVETHSTLRLPAGVTTSTPTGTSVQRDYATFASRYSTGRPADEATKASSSLQLMASRHINFILREIPTERAADYNAFMHAVQNDESQEFTLDRHDAALKASGSAKTATH
ncbi:MAG: hypothetical protein NVS9B4_14780 [Candidatus Acidiferrum sp.]